VNILLGAEPLYSPLTGIGQYTKNLADGLARRGDISDLRYFAHGRVLSGIPSEPAHDQAGNAAARAGYLTRMVRRVRPVLAASPLAVRIYERVLPIASRRNLERYANTHVLHSPNFVLPEYSGRSVVTIHDLSTLLMPRFHPPARAGFVNRSMERAVTSADHIITDSEFVRRQVLEHFHVREDRCTAIGLGASEEFRPRNEADCRRVLSAYGLEFKRYGLFVSTIEPRKNLRRVLHAYQACARRQVSRFPLVIVGHTGWRSGREHEMIRKYQDAGLVKYVGYAPAAELAVLFSAARMLVFPSLYEGFGLPVLEAMQSGTAVLTSRSSSMEEVCDAAAVTVEPRDIRAISDAVELLMHDDQLVDRLATAGVERAQRYSWSRCVELTMRTYQSLF
jgi:alpha-1,3-rhamnosyl/mannosyltransferase